MTILYASDLKVMADVISIQEEFLHKMELKACRVALSN
jgi:hypothetical protein